MAIRRTLAAEKILDRFRFVVLSDTDDPAIAHLEEAAMAAFERERDDGGECVYRRRRDNSGFKAGNIADFLAREGDAFDFFIPLDSDSLMEGRTIAAMVVAMERHPQIGILQSLVVGLPSKSAFARIFQFGMRHGMRSFTMGASWWAGDCGAYWGHNAVIRVAPFRRHCMLPKLAGSGPLGGDVLSHDQLEAVLMRRAGFEVRVIPLETGSYEVNPPTLPDFIRRDLRWCLGNMQYPVFLRLKGLLPVGRFQILQAILMYVAPPAWLAMTAAACLRALKGGDFDENLELGLALFVAVFLMSVAPKIAGVLDIALTQGGTRSYGGTARFAASAAIELLFSMLIAPVVAVSVSLFLLGLPFGRTIVWSGQNRDRLGIAWMAAARAMAVQTGLGLVLAGTMLVNGWSAVFWVLPFAAGLLLSIPLTVLTANEAFGRALQRSGLFAIPEEHVRPRVIDRAVELFDPTSRLPVAAE